MANLVQAVQGTLVGAEAKAYGAFKDRDGDERPGGITRKVYVSQSFDSAPIEISVPAAHELTFSELRALGIGAPVNILCEVRAFNNNISLKLIEFTVNGHRKDSATAAAK